MDFLRYVKSAEKNKSKVRRKLDFRRVFIKTIKI